MNPIGLVFCSLMIFFSMHAHALTPISAEKACSTATSSYARQCRSQLSQDNYYDGYASAACATAFSSYIPDCIQAVTNKYYQRGAAEACATAYSSYVRGCLIAVGNKRFSKDAISSCRSSFSSKMASCFNNSASQPNTGGEPVVTSPFSVCQRLNVDSATACYKLVGDSGGEDAFDPLAVGVCNRPFKGQASLILECLQTIAGLSFKDPNSIRNCARSESHSKATQCLGSVGSQDDGENSPGVCHIGAGEIRFLLKLNLRAKRSLENSRERRTKNILHRISGQLEDCLEGDPIQN